MEPSSSEGQNKDLLYFFSKAGRKIGSIFKRKDSLKVENPVKQSPTASVVTSENGSQSEGIVYANALALSEIKKQIPNFPVGSILVRERHDTGTDKTPEAIIAMVKRANGFSDKTNDWEFFVLSKDNLKLQSRETTGSCATCHIRAQKTDWVFLEYLK
ncbi:MAG: cytochrome P460 family protein [Chloracidobacterium sp.]|nr:cytochrome P460 family protein [Chloracidobacterium sp.]